MFPEAFFLSFPLPADPLSLEIIDPAYLPYAQQGQVKFTPSVSE